MYIRIYHYRETEVDLQGMYISHVYHTNKMADFGAYLGLRVHSKCQQNAQQ